MVYSNWFVINRYFFNSPARIDFSRTISDNTICRNNYYSYFWLSTVLTELYSTKEIRKVNDVLLSTEPKLLHSSIVPKTILFNNVLITYEEKNIGPINLELYSGKKYIIIGKNGSGKSSFLKLLTQEINQYQGKILLNQQQELRTVDFSTMIGYVSQKPSFMMGQSQKILLLSINLIKRSYMKLVKKFLVPILK